MFQQCSAYGRVRIKDCFLFKIPVMVTTNMARGKEKKKKKSSMRTVEALPNYSRKALMPGMPWPFPPPTDIRVRSWTRYVNMTYQCKQLLTNQWFTGTWTAKNVVLGWATFYTGRSNYGCPLLSMTAIYNSRCLSRARKILKDTTYPSFLNLLPSGRHLKFIRTRTNWLR